jgi:hypothetical protein
VKELLEAFKQLLIMKSHQQQARQETTWAGHNFTLQSVFSADRDLSLPEDYQAKAETAVAAVREPRSCNVSGCKVFAAFKGILTVVQLCGLFPLGGLVTCSRCSRNQSSNGRIINDNKLGAKGGADSSVWPKKAQHHEIWFKWASLPTIYTFVVLCIFALIGCLTFSELKNSFDGSTLTSSSKYRKSL